MLPSHSHPGRVRHDRQTRRRRKEGLPPGTFRRPRWSTHPQGPRRSQMKIRFGIAPGSYDDMVQEAVLETGSAHLVSRGEPPRGAVPDRWLEQCRTGAAGWKVQANDRGATPQCLPTANAGGAQAPVRDPTADRTVSLRGRRTDVGGAVTPSGGTPPESRPVPAAMGYGVSATWRPSAATGRSCSEIP